MPITREKARKMEETLKQLMEMIGEMKTEIKTNQDKLSKEMKIEMKSSQETLSKEMTEMKTNQEKLSSEMRTSQEKLEEKLSYEMKTIQEKLSTDMKANQDELRHEVKLIQEETKQDKQELMKQFQENSNRLEESMKIKFKDFEETVEEEISHIGNRVQVIEDTLVNIEAEIEKKINKSTTVKETEMEKKVKSLEAKLVELSTVGVVKTEGSSVLPSRIKPPTFDGKVSWSTYLRQFEAAAIANHWSTEEKTTSLIVALRGEALEVLRSIPEDKQQDYEVLTTALEMRYGEAHLQHLYQAQLKGRRQRYEESMQQFETDIARMVNLAYPTAPADFKEQLAVSSFIDGLRDSEISQALRLARHKNVAEALAQALEIEAAKQASRNSQGRIRQINTLRLDQREKTVDKTEELIKGMRELLDSLQNGQKQASSTVFSNRRTIRCWNCGSEGHLRNRCPKNTQSNQDQENAN